MKQIQSYIFSLIMLFPLLQVMVPCNLVFANTELLLVNSKITLQLDTTIEAEKEKVRQDSLTFSKLFENMGAPKINSISDTIQVVELSKYPYVSLEQFLKGGVAGVHVQETSGEPGTVKQNFYIRGLNKPILNAKNYHDNKPLVVVNGVPLLEDPSFVYDIQNNSEQPIGAATNIFSFMDLDNIESIEVIKDLSGAAIYGPRAANGVIYITTKTAKPTSKMFAVNGYTGFVSPVGVTTINGEFEKNFRLPFYNKYANERQLSSFPSYLSDSTNVNYYGASDWVDLYYKVTPSQSLNTSFTGGSGRSNFRFFGSYTSNSAGADATKLDRYYGAFYINMLPSKWLTVSSNIQLGRIDRNRNKSFIERFSETSWVPDLTNPLAPTKNMYQMFLTEDEKSFDKNLSTSLLGTLSLLFKPMKGLNFSTSVSMDYNENARNLFWPSTIMSGNSYVSNYLGYNERFNFDNLLTYDLNINDISSWTFQGGFSIQSDKQKYNYAQGYRGPNDFIKVMKVNGNSSAGDYLATNGFIPYLYADRLSQSLVSSFFKTDLLRDNVYKISGLIRRDGTSLMQSSDRWFTSYAINGEYNLNSFLFNFEKFDYIKLLASYTHLGELPYSNMGVAGPQYTSNIGWNGQAGLSSYNGLGTINRPYTTGWSDYDINWSYVDMVNLGVSLSINNSFTFNAEVYQSDNNNILTQVPGGSESGYEYVYASGLGVKNKGVDLSLGYKTKSNNSNKLSWTSSFNISYNTNELTSLPNDLNNIISDKKKLEVGNRIDRFWLLQNRGVYQNDLDVPVDPNTYKILNYNGTVMKAGDPRWVDVNNDFNINNEDRVLIGNILPQYAGGWMNSFGYKGFDLSFFLYFNLKKDIINQQASKYFDFVNVSETNTLYNVRDITYWEKNFNENAYPLLNPWSPVGAYQPEQDMFLEDGSFLKLKNVSLGYDLTKHLKTEKISKLYLYTTATNLFTLTKYSGRDPELVNYMGYDMGVGIRLPRTFSLGFKMDL